MSRIGRQPIPVPTGVTVSIEPEQVRVNGPKGELAERVHRDIAVTQPGRRGRQRRTQIIAGPEFGEPGHGQDLDRRGGAMVAARRLGQTRGQT